MSESQSESGFRVDQIDHVELVVPDRDQAAEWYARVLGLGVLPEYRHWALNRRGPLMISSDGGSTKLALFEGVPQASSEAAGFQLVAFRTSGEGFLTFLAKLPDLGLLDHHGAPLIREAAVDHAEAWSVYFCDPFGHHLELTTYDHERVRAGTGRRGDR